MLDSYAIGPNGSVSPIGSPQTGVTATQSGPVQSMAVDPTGTYLYTNEIAAYPIRSDGSLGPASATLAPPANGVVMDPGGRFLFANDAMANVITYRIDSPGHALTALPRPRSASGKLRCIRLVSTCTLQTL
jgi:6-phosphogluconolactonase (cycloisomerase 2 family)